MKCWVPRWFSGGGCIPMCKQQTTKSSIHTMSKGQFEAIPSTPGKRGLEAFGRLSDWWRFLTQHFRYLKWRYTEPYKAILRVGFPLHKPYPYSLYRWVVSTFILGTCNVWWFAPPIFQSFESDRITPKKSQLTTENTNLQKYPPCKEKGETWRNIENKSTIFSEASECSFSGTVTKPQGDEPPKESRPYFFPPSKKGSDMKNILWGGTLSQRTDIPFQCKP